MKNKIQNNAYDISPSAVKSIPIEYCEISIRPMKKNSLSPNFFIC